MGMEFRFARSLFRRRAGLCLPRCPAGLAPQGGAVSDEATRPVQRGLSRRLGRRALSARSRRWRTKIAPDHGCEAGDSLRTSGTRRHAPESAGVTELFPPDLQAHPDASLAPDLRLR